MDVRQAVAKLVDALVANLTAFADAIRWWLDALANLLRKAFGVTLTEGDAVLILVGAALYAALVLRIMLFK